LSGNTTPKFSVVSKVRHEASRFDITPFKEHGRQSRACGKSPCIRAQREALACQTHYGMGIPYDCFHEAPF
jgi:hypothetical protein